MIDFATWLSGTSLSLSIQNELWVIPTLQSIHIIAIAAVVSSVLFINLRLLRVADRNHSVLETVQRFLPWLWTGLIILFLTGATLVVGEPLRELSSVPFWIKMALIVCGIILTTWFQRSLSTEYAAWDAGRSSGRIRMFAIANLVIWVAIIVAGRLIAYVY